MRTKIEFPVKHFLGIFWGMVNLEKVVQSEYTAVDSIIASYDKPQRG
jgi:hypothetical protein